MSERPPTRESIAQEMSEIIRYVHDAYGIDPITESTLRTAIKGLTTFYLKETDLSETIPYQYKRESQKDFEIHQVIISSALDMVEPVITDIKTKTFRLEKLQPTLMPSEPQSPPMMMMPPQQQEQKKRSFSLFPQKQQKPMINPNDPYQSSLAMQRRIADLIDSWELVVEWQSGGVEFVSIDGDHDLNRFGFDNYLSNHRQIFRFGVVPNLLRVYSQGLTLLLKEEKQLASQYGNNMMKEMFQTRNDMPHM